MSNSADDRTANSAFHLPSGMFDQHSDPTQSQRSAAGLAPPPGFPSGRGSTYERSAPASDAGSRPGDPWSDDFRNLQIDDKSRSSRSGARTPLGVSEAEAGVFLETAHKLLHMSGAHERLSHDFGDLLSKHNELLATLQSCAEELNAAKQYIQHLKGQLDNLSQERAGASITADRRAAALEETLGIMQHSQHSYAEMRTRADELIKHAEERGITIPPFSEATNPAVTGDL